MSAALQPDLAGRSDGPAILPRVGAPTGAGKDAPEGPPSGRADARPWYAREADEVVRSLAAGPDGLSAEEAARRLAAYGPNEVPAGRETPWWALALHQFRAPLIYVLLVAAAVTLALQHYTDAGVILAVVVLNAIIGFVQEHRAQQAMQALARLNAPRADVVRGGRTETIPSRELVQGDLVLLASGTRVPADLRLLSVRDLTVDESALTGESLPVHKQSAALDAAARIAGDQVNMAFAGTVATHGRGRGVVVRTGAETELGRIAEAVHATGVTRTPIEEKTARLGRQVGLAVALLVGAVAVIGLLQGVPPVEILLVAVAMAVAVVPEGLPVVITVTLAVGVRRMARRNAIIRSLPAVETLGSTSVIGSDKTGTLTKNEMTVTDVWAAGQRYSLTGTGYDAEGSVMLGTEPAGPDALREDGPLGQTLVAGVLASEAEAAALDEGRLTGDPTELALLIAAGKAGLAPSGLREAQPELDVVPFESEQRFMATLNERPGGRRVYLKGAPEVVLARCDRQLTDAGEAPIDAADARAAADALAASGLRVLAMAYRDTDAERLDEALVAGGFVLAGFQGLTDPVRPEAVDAVAAAQAAGIRVLMLTGDHAGTARVAGRHLGLDPHEAGAVEGHALEALSDADLDRVLQEVNLFARVAPEHKLRIVERLKAGGAVVAVTGDGVNDAPALSAAHIGVAMGRGGTDVAREASDMVLADDNFATLTAAVEQGRVVFSNIRKVTFFLLSTAVGEIVVILAALLAGWPLPFVAAQILWINLVTTGLQDVALAFEPGEPGLLRQPARPLREGLVTRRLIERLGGVGLVLALGTLGAFWWAWQATGDLVTARSVAMTQMVVFQFFHVFNCRSLDRSIFRIPLLSNRFLFVSILAAAGAHLAVLHVPALQDVFRTTPLTATQWGVILLVGTTVVLGGELDKWWNRRRHRLLG